MNLSYLCKRAQVPFLLVFVGLLTLWMAWEVLAIQLEALSTAPGLG